MTVKKRCQEHSWHLFPSSSHLAIGWNGGDGPVSLDRGFLPDGPSQPARAAFARLFAVSEKVSGAGTADVPEFEVEMKRKKQLTPSRPPAGASAVTPHPTRCQQAVSRPPGAPAANRAALSGPKGAVGVLAPQGNEAFVIVNCVAAGVSGAFSCLYLLMLFAYAALSDVPLIVTILVWALAACGALCLGVFSGAAPVRNSSRLPFISLALAILEWGLLTGTAVAFLKAITDNPDDIYMLAPALLPGLVVPLAYPPTICALLIHRRASR
jgi:hypothetical protein